MPVALSSAVERRTEVSAAPSGTLIACVGYRSLRDLSAGNEVIDRLMELNWPDGVEIEDLSYGPMDVIFRLREARFARLVVVASASRPELGRSPGMLYRRDWTYEPESPADVQARVAEAVTGVISLDNLLVICAHFEALPEDVILLEIEPEDDSWGEGFTPRVAQLIDEIVAELHASFGERST